MLHPVSENECKKSDIHQSLQIRNSIFQANREWTLSMTYMQEMVFVAFILLLRLQLSHLKASVSDEVALVPVHDE